MKGWCDEAGLLLRSVTRFIPLILQRITNANYFVHIEENVIGVQSGYSHV